MWTPAWFAAAYRIEPGVVAVVVCQAAVAAVYGAAAVPAAHVDARVALRTPTTRLSRSYGIFLATLGVVLFIIRI
jgi:hypothetical protein